MTLSAAQETPYSHELAWPPHLRPFDPWDESIKADPYAHYAWMHEHAPVLRARTPAGDAWFLSRYRDVQLAFRSAKIFSSRRPDPKVFPNVVASDEPDHTRLRSVVAHAFTPKAVARVEGQVRATAEGLLRPMIASGGGEVVGNFAIPLTMSTIAGLMGLSLSKTAQFRQWTEDYTSLLGRLLGSSPGSPTDASGTAAFVAHMDQALDAAPLEADTVLSCIARSRADGKITGSEAAAFGPLLFDAGSQTTSLLIGNGFIVLSEMPHLLARLRANPADVPKFVEELLRCRSSVHRMRRVTTESVEVSGQRIPEGAAVYLLMAAANRDAEKFPNPAVFDMDRDTGGHLGFGFGIHACLGSWLARMEARIVFELLAQTVSAVALDPDPRRAVVPMTAGSGVVSGPKALTVRLAPLQ